MRLSPIVPLVLATALWGCETGDTSTAPTPDAAGSASDAMLDGTATAPDTGTESPPDAAPPTDAAPLRVDGPPSPTPTDAHPPAMEDAQPPPVDAAPPPMDAATDPIDAGPQWPRTRVFVGTGRWSGPPGQIFVYDLDAEGGYTRLGRQMAGNLASFLALDGERRKVYMADEGGSRWLGFSIDPDNAQLTERQSSPTSAGPVYVVTDPTGRWLLTATYGGGQVQSFDTETGAQVDVEATGAQTHSVLFSRDGAFVYAASKGNHWVGQYAFDATDGTLTPAGTVPVAGNAGPRHLTFHPTLDVLYLMNESDGQLVLFDRNGATGQLTQRATASTLPADFAGQATGADLHFTPDGEHLFFTLRVSGANGLVGVYDVDERGDLSNPRFVDTRGQTPRNFDIDPTGRFLSVANRESSTIAVFRIEADGGLTFVTTVAVDDTPFFVGTVQL